LRRVTRSSTDDVAKGVLWGVWIVVVASLRRPGSSGAGWGGPEESAYGGIPSSLITTAREHSSSIRRIFAVP